MRCDYAACPRQASDLEDGWWFCPRHLTEHRFLRNGLELPDLPADELPISHGTEAGGKQHRRRGERPCPECAEAERVARRSRSVAA